MSPETALLVGAAGMAAGFMNAVVGAGTLVTFPTLLAAGYPPVVANASNCLGLIAGSVSGAWGFRKTLARGSRRTLLGLCLVVGAGALLGGTLLLALPAGVFSAAVPVLVGLGCVLMFVPTRIPDARTAPGPPTRRATALSSAMFASGVYGGYFGAAQGVIMLGILRLLHSTDPREMNATKNLLGAVANATAGVIFVFAADIAWEVVLLISTGSVMGGSIGARFGQSLSPRTLRAAVVIIAVCAVAASMR